MIFNNEIKIILLFYYKHNILLTSFYDADYNYIKAFGSVKYSLNNFEKKDLRELKKLALKLSKDFPNFIRVDLYLFKNEIYLSELTFDSHSGIPALTDIKYFNDGLKNWKRYDY